MWAALYLCFPNSKLSCKLYIRRDTDIQLFTVGEAQNRSREIQRHNPVQRGRQSAMYRRTAKTTESNPLSGCYVIDSTHLELDEVEIWKLTQVHVECIPRHERRVGHTSRVSSK